MQIYRGFPGDKFTQPIFLTIGNFDGVHRGHQMLAVQLVQAARGEGGLAGLLTFEPHPLAVLRPDLHIPRLTSNEERASLLSALSLDFLLEIPFTRDTAATSATEFMAALVERLPLRELWVGPDFALGHGREGDAARLDDLGESLGYNVRIIPSFDWQGEPVRSTRIRSLLQDEGAVTEAATLLGRPYAVWGEVVLGAQRGRSLGFPTANLALPEDRLVPAHGVYACWAWRGDEGHPAVVNVGVRPSFDNGHASVEAYLLDFAGDLYGETLGLTFVARLRGEKKFPNIQDLVAQIRLDSERARGILAEPSTDATGGGWEELEHTADWQIRVAGEDPRQLFANAAAGMYALQEANFAQPAELGRSVSVDAGDSAGLLVAWLNRLLLGQELGGEMYNRYVIHEISERGLRATAFGYKGTPAHTAIKAVTYYDLDVRDTGAGWVAKVTFDV